MSEPAPITNQRVHIDGEDLRGKTFANCTIIFSGGNAPKLGNTAFKACAWEFLGAAANTMSLLNTLYNHDDALREFVTEGLLGGHMEQDSSDDADQN